MKDPKDYISGEILGKLGDWSDDVLDGVRIAQKDAFNKGLEAALNYMATHALKGQVMDYLKYKND